MAPRTVTTPAFIQLSKVTESSGRSSSRSRYNDSDEDTGQAEVAIPTTPVVIAVDSIRCYYARKSGQPGTRITFKDGGGFAVLQTMDSIKAAIGADVPVVGLPALEAPTAAPAAEGTTQAVN